MTLSSYKAFLFDVDRTLTNSKKEVTQNTQRAVKLVQARKFLTGVCTGRHFTTLKDDAFTHFRPTDLHVVSGGSQVIDTTGKILWENCISYTKVKDLVEEMDALKTRIYLQTGSTIYGNARAVDQWRVTPLAKHPIHIAPMSQMPKVAIPIVIIHDIDEEIFEKILQHSGISGKFMKNHEGGFYSDITAEGVTKLSGFREWCRIQHIKAEEVIGFGDSENDLEFLERVGYAIAMGNAQENVKAKADEVIGDCDKDGIAEWIAKQLSSM